MKKKVVRRVWIGLAVFLCIAIVLAGSYLFVFGVDVLEDSGGDSVVQAEGKVAVNILGSEVEDKGDVLDDSSNVVSEDVAAGGGGGSSGGGDSVPAPVCVEFLPVQYSLGEFNENIECLVYGVGGCERVSVSCSSELYNLDYNVGGLFGVRFSIVSGDEVLFVEVIEDNVGARERSVFRSEVVLPSENAAGDSGEPDGSFDVGSMECVVDMESVAGSCLTWEYN